jgi:UDP-N-acetylmuramate dehydrogenase
MELLDLKNYNTFGIRCIAAEMIKLNHVTQIDMIIEEGMKKNLLILGGGSNILFTKDIFDGVVVVNRLLGKQIVAQTDEHVYLYVAAGENWHALTEYTVQQQWGGIENLSLIPGTAGAAPIQNIGAYGVELSEVLENVECIELFTAKKYVFDAKACEFGYRTSRFKTKDKNRFLITAITLKLSKYPILKYNYPALQEKIKLITKPTIADVAAAVIAIRQEKLPDPAVTGNAGSFFKNPVIDRQQLEKLLAILPDVPIYFQEDHLYKIPAAFLIERAGWKGYREGRVGCHAKQPLVIVNYGNATGAEIVAFAQRIQQSIIEKYDIMLEPEVNYI